MLSEYLSLRASKFLSQQVYYITFKYSLQESKYLLYNSQL